METQTAVILDFVWPFPLIYERNTMTQGGGSRQKTCKFQLICLAVLHKICNFVPIFQ